LSVYCNYRFADLWYNEVFSCFNNFFPCTYIITYLDICYSYNLQEISGVWEKDSKLYFPIFSNWSFFLAEFFYSTHFWNNSFVFFMNCIFPSSLQVQNQFIIIQFDISTWKEFFFKIYPEKYSSCDAIQYFEDFYHTLQ